MTESQLMFGLKRRYGKTLGLLRAGEDRSEDLAHLAAVIRMFNPDEDLSLIRPIGPYRERRERWSRDALSILRQANSALTVRTLVRLVLSTRSVPQTRSNIERVESTLRCVLKRLEGRDVVRESNSPQRWRCIDLVPVPGIARNERFQDGLKGWARV
jgi:hypothetical protein